ncbi:UbiA family prenyltransferase [Candidatus Parcubacteria bacterium]|nr:UbiA family prenyltransferase [Candidatus Parcubacteria bacterium]
MKKQIQTIKVFIELIRPLNCLMVSAGVIIGSIAGIGMDFSFALLIFLAVLSAAITNAGGNAMNDYFDRETDIMTHPKRPIPSKRLTPKSVLMFAIACFILAIIFSVRINLICFILVIINTAMLIFYERYLKNKGLIGNIAVAYLTGSIFLFGGAVVGRITTSAILAILAFFATLGREIIKDVEDISGDRKERETMPMKIGEKNSIIIANFCLITAVLFSFLPLVANILGKGYLIVVAADSVFIYSMFIAFKNPHSAQKAIKLGMILALISFFFGSI